MGIKRYIEKKFFRIDVFGNYAISFWFFGRYRLYIKRISKAGLLFSQRNGYTGKIIGDFFFEFDKPQKLC